MVVAHKILRSSLSGSSNDGALNQTDLAELT